MDELKKLLAWRLRYDTDKTFAEQQERNAAQHGYLSAIDAWSSKVQVITNPEETWEIQKNLN